MASCSLPSSVRRLSRTIRAASGAPLITGSPQAVPAAAARASTTCAQQEHPGTIESATAAVLDKSLFEAQRDDEIVLCLNYDGLYGINNINRFLQSCNPGAATTWRVSTYKVGDPVLFNETERFRPVIYNIFCTAVTRARERLKIFWTPETQQAVLKSLRRSTNPKDVALLSSRRGLTPVAGTRLDQPEVRGDCRRPNVCSSGDQSPCRDSQRTWLTPQHRACAGRTSETGREVAW